MIFVKIGKDDVPTLTEQDIRHAATLEKLTARLAAEKDLSEEELLALIHVAGMHEVYGEYTNPMYAAMYHLAAALYGKESIEMVSKPAHEIVLDALVRMGVNVQDLKMPGGDEE
jgi:hypothetical protein